MQRAVDSEPPLLGQLKRYEIERLFGSRSLGFDLAHPEPTVLTGANGSGKSTILRTIDSIGSGDWMRLLQLPFGRIVLTFDSRHTISISRQESALIIGMDSDDWRFDPTQLPQVELSESTLPIRRTGVRTWEYRGRVYNERQATRLVAVEQMLARDAPPWLVDLPHRFPILYITDQRLIVDPTLHRDPARTSMSSAVSTRRAVHEAARHLSRTIGITLSDYGLQSQRYDRDFPRRIVQEVASEADVAPGELQALLKQVARERDALMKVGLLPIEYSTDPFGDLSVPEPAVRKVMRAFLNDTLQKFAVLDDLRDRIQLFTAFLNQHYEGKRVVVEQEEGFVIRLADTTEGQLSPADLSSGEQQILVLAFEMLFRAKPGTLVLIDEPELSLNVLWQDSFLDDITRMGRSRDLSFLLATHSPVLLGGRDDLKRSLDIN